MWQGFTRPGRKKARNPCSSITGEQWLQGRHRVKTTLHSRMRRNIALFLSLSAGGICAYGQSDSSSSPYATAADFARYAMKSGNETFLKVEPIVQIPTSSHAATTRFPWKTSIVTTVFWIGEQAGGNNLVPNYRSCWDANWTNNYGGFDNPESSARRDYIPVAFVPRQIHSIAHCPTTM